MGSGKTKHGYKLVKTLFSKQEIPESWSIQPLGSLSTLYVPMRDKPKKFGGTIPWLRIEDLDGKYVKESKSSQKVSHDTVKEMKLRIYPKGTILCSCSATLGVCALTTAELITNQTFIGIHPNSELDNEFLYYYMTTQSRNLIRISSGTTIPYISRKKFEELPIIFPTKQKEQQKIGLILSNVDNLIQNSNQIIKQTHLLKKGIIQKLLTEGIGHTNFKKVKVNFCKEIQIPKKWNITKFKELTNRIIVGIAESSTQAYRTSGVPLIFSANVKPNYLKKDGIGFIDNAFALKNKSKSLKSSDILIVRSGVNSGDAAVVPDSLNNAQCFTLLISSVKPQHDPYFFCYYINSEFCQRYFDATGWGSAQRNLNVRIIKGMSVPVPPKEEQQKIVSILSNIDGQIEKEKLRKSNLEQLKKELTQKLLTGTIRVKF